MATAEWRYDNARAQDMSRANKNLNQFWEWIRKKVIALEAGTLDDLGGELRKLGTREAQIPGMIEALATSENLIVKDGKNWRLTDEKLALKQAESYQRKRRAE